MSYYDPARRRSVRTRDRLRDVLEFDPDVQAVFAGPILGLWRDAVPDPATEDQVTPPISKNGVMVSVSLVRSRMQTATGVRTNKGMTFALTIQLYDGPNPSANNEATQSALIDLTDALTEILVEKYQTEPFQVEAGRLWDELIFLNTPDCTVYDRVPGRHWYSTTLFRLNCYY